MKTRVLLPGALVTIAVLVALVVQSGRRGALRDHPAPPARAPANSAPTPSTLPLQPTAAELSPVEDSGTPPAKAITAAEVWRGMLGEIARVQALPAGDPGREPQLAWLLADLVSADAAGAARFFAAQPPGEARDELLRLLAKAWSEVDFSGAVAWAATLPDPGERRLAFEHACFQDARVNPGEAIDAWLAFDNDPTRAVYGDLVQAWAARDLPAAVAWAQARPKSDARDQAMARVAFVMTRENPAQAAQLITAQISPGATQTEAVVMLVQIWAKRDLVAATTWLNEQPDARFNARARAEIAGVQQQPSSSN